MDSSEIDKLAKEVSSLLSKNLKKEAAGTLESLTNRLPVGWLGADTASTLARGVDSLLGTDDSQKGLGKIDKEAKEFYESGKSTTHWDAPGLSIANTDNYYIKNKNLYGAGFAENLGLLGSLKRVTLGDTSLFGSEADSEEKITPEKAKSIVEAGIAYFKNSRGDLVQARVLELFMKDNNLPLTSLQATGDQISEDDIRALSRDVVAYLYRSGLKKEAREIADLVAVLKK